MRILVLSLITFFICLLVFGGIALYILRRTETLPIAQAYFGERVITVELATSALSRARGLSYRDSLEEGKGMLFLFGSVKQHVFWMQGMRFPIDIIWLHDGEVVDITADISPAQSLTDSMTTYKPRIAANEVLEVPAGYAEKIGITVGSRMVLR